MKSYFRKILRMRVLHSSVDYWISPPAMCSMWTAAWAWHLSADIMERVAFKMFLDPGMADEYKRRHDQIWPELKELLKESGVSEYSIFLDESTHELTGVMRVADPRSMENLPEQPVMQKWWQHMKDIMRTNSDGSPSTRPLKE